MSKDTTVVINGNQRFKLRRKLIIAIVLIIATVLLYVYLASTFLINKSFAEETDEFYKLNQKTIFSIDKIYMYSSASAIENNEKKPIWNINLFQFTDIAIYINSHSDNELTNENSIKELYIDNIKFGDVKLGTQSLYYKDINDFGKSLIKKNEETASSQYDTEVQNIDANGNEVTEENQNVAEQSTEEPKKQSTSNTNDAANSNETNIDTLLKNETKLTDRLDYSVLNDGDVDYSKPQIYADASNPISLEYINSDIKKNQILSDISSDVTYDGSLLRRGSVVISDISSHISFNINIVNNYNQKFVANVYIDIPLEDTVTGDTIYNGKFVKKIESENYIKFFRIK